MYQQFKPLAAALCLTITMTSCYNSHNAENILGKWQGTYTENCATANRISAVQIEFTADKKFTAIITAPGEPPATTSGTYVMERYQLIFINGGQTERDIQKIESLSSSSYSGSFSNERCHGTTKLNKVSS